jgi:hypothetical protein
MKPRRPADASPRCSACLPGRRRVVLLARGKALVTGFKLPPYLVPSPC